MLSRLSQLPGVPILPLNLEPQDALPAPDQHLPIGKGGITKGGSGEIQVGGIRGPKVLKV